MESIVTDGRITFKELEKKIYRCVCENAMEMTQTILEAYDKELHKSRDRAVYRDKGVRATTIKTIYGDVSYKRKVYETEGVDGQKKHVYLLDESIRMDRIGRMSVNLAETVAFCVTENSYRAAAEIVSVTGGQQVSHGGAWKLIQRLGRKIGGEEDTQVRQMEAGEAKGKKTLPVLFEEMDGVWLRLQGKDHKSVPKQEMKVATFYEGWADDGGKRSRLCGKKVLAGMEKSGEFLRKREAQIQSVYDPDEIGYRVLNGDGGAWIQDPYEPDTIFQLDPFHVEREIRRKIPQDKEMAQEIGRWYREGKPEEMLRHIQMYADSVDNTDESDRRAEKARELYRYLAGNREGLLPYQSRGIDFPKPPEGMRYANLGVQENQNATVITLRMKGKRRRWSVEGANHMAKVLYRKENQELSQSIRSYGEKPVFPGKMWQSLAGFSAAKAPKKEGKGNPYVDVIGCQVPIRGARQGGFRQVVANISR
jgi:hypothetical protein